MFPPILSHAKEVLVDGGIVNNFPTDVVVEREGPGKVIGVDVSMGTGRMRDYSYSEAISGWDVLKGRISGDLRSKTVPSLAKIMAKTIMVNANQVTLRNRELCDLLIQPDVREIGLMQFERFTEAAQAGYMAAKRAVQPLQQSDALAAMGVQGGGVVTPGGA